MGAEAVQVRSKLPDGRSMRALEGTYTQKMMFTLSSSGLYNPANEGIMSVKEHDQSIQSGAYKSVNVNGWWRTGEYAFYPKGFEKRNLPLGDKLVYVEDGVAHTLNIPDVPVKLANGQTVGLRQAISMGVIKLEKLKLDQIDDKADVVSVTTDFDPATDVKVVDIMRPSAWALVDADGYALKSQPSDAGVSEARYSRVRHSDEFEDRSTGYHGSLARGVYGYVNDDRRVVYAYGEWRYGSGVALVSGRGATAPLVGVPEEKLAKIADPKALVQRAEQLQTAATELTERLGSVLTPEAYARLIKPTLDEVVFLTELAGKIEAISK